MNIEHLRIEGLYGYINKEIDFKKDISLLVGINGSGKTSILNIISWLIKPSISHLCVTHFKSIELSFTLKGKKYSILCKHTKKQFCYELLSADETFEPLTVELEYHPENLTDDDTLKNRILENYVGLGPSGKEIKTWNFIKANLPSPTIIGLDRNLYTEESDKLYIEETVRGRIAQKKGNTSPVEKVKEIVNTDYRKQKNEILNLTNRLKNHLILSAFDGSITLDSVSSGIRYKLQLSQIEIAETRVSEYFQQFEKLMFSESEQKIIANYFSQLKTITKQFQENPKDENTRFLFGLNASQFRKINKLLKEFEKFEKESNKTLERINLYLKTLNYFFKDSSKELVFKEDTAEITFNTLDKKGNPLTRFRDIRFLSSGEQQILILFSYLAFNNEDGRLFIIDEPELSLHIKWQEDFLQSLELVTPKSTQVIIATHSPILVAKKKENTILLYPYNQ